MLATVTLPKAIGWLDPSSATIPLEYVPSVTEMTIWLS